MSSRSTEPAPRWRGTLGFRLGLWYALLFAASGLVLIVVTYLLLASALARRDHDLIFSALDRYATTYEIYGVGGLQAAVSADRLGGRNESVFVRVLGAREEALFLSGPGTWSNLEGASRQLPDGTVLEVGKSSEARRDILARFRAQALVLGLTVGAIGILGGALLTRRALAPVGRLSAALARIVRTGEVEARVPVRGQNDPLDELSRLFNEMLDRIEALIAGLRGSLDNVAHDLRTPLARLRATLEGALRADDLEAAQASIADGLEEADRVASMLTTLMDISEAETGTMALRREPVGAAALLREAHDLYEDSAESKGVSLTVDAADDLVVPGDRRRLLQAVANLTDNAVKYTPAGGQVTLRARREGEAVALECADDGPGIDAADRPHIWDRLYRSDRSRSERGLGLGLSLVRAIARAHGGDATWGAAPGGGSCFRIVLPAASITKM